MEGDDVADWVDVDLRAAMPGWRAAFLTEDGTDVRSLVGWLVQRRGRERRLVAATFDGDGRVVPVEHDARFWKVMAPEDVHPTWDEAMEEHGRRLALAGEASAGDVVEVPAEWRVEEGDDAGA